MTFVVNSLDPRLKALASMHMPLVQLDSLRAFHHILIRTEPNLLNALARPPVVRLSVQAVCAPSLAALVRPNLNHATTSIRSCIRVHVLLLPQKLLQIFPFALRRASNRRVYRVRLAPRFAIHRVRILQTQHKSHRLLSHRATSAALTAHVVTYQLLCYYMISCSRTPKPSPV